MGPGTELDFLPETIVQLWRVAFIVLACHVLGQRLPLLLSMNRALPTWARYGQAAVVLILIRSIVVQVQRWEAPLLLEGLPVNTAFVVLLWLGGRAYKREHP